MKFNAYIVELKHKDNSITGSLITPDQIVSANFKKIAKDLFIANFKTQIEFKFMEKVSFKNRDKEILILLPMISDFNKRKLVKISKFITPVEGIEKYSLLLNLLSVEKILKVEEILPFISISRDEIIEFLLKKEAEKKIKIIDFSHLSIIDFDVLQSYLDQMNIILTDYYTTRAKIIQLSEIEKKLKLPYTSIFFKYLLLRCANNFSIKISRDKISFQKVALSDNEKGLLEVIESTLKREKITIFTMENILKHSNLLHKEINDSIWFLVEGSQVIQLNEKHFIFKEELDKILNKLKKFKRNQGEIIDIQSFRELILLSRKFLIILFEYFDSNGITERLESQRKILLSV